MSGAVEELTLLMDEWNASFEPRNLRIGPGIAIPFSGEPPRFTRDLDGEEWHCPRCGVTVPAGVMPFPHQGCEPGTIIDVWSADLAMGREFDAVEFDWPPRLALEQQQQIVLVAMQDKVRFTGYPRGVPSLDITPRPVRQRLYREFA